MRLVQRGRREKFNQSEQTLQVVLSIQLVDAFDFRLGHCFKFFFNIGVQFAIGFFCSFLFFLGFMNFLIFFIFFILCWDNLWLLFDIYLGLLGDFYFNILGFDFF